VERGRGGGKEERRKDGRKAGRNAGPERGKLYDLRKHCNNLSKSENILKQSSAKIAKHGRTFKCLIGLEVMLCGIC